RQTSLADERKPAIYVPIAQAPQPFLLRELSFVARTSGDPVELAPSIRQEFAALDPMLPVGRVAAMSALIADSVSQPRFRAVLLGAFAVSALVLITVGIVGVLGYHVALRTREIGVRVALGAQRVDVVRWIVKEAILLTGTGVGLGAAVAYAVTGVLARFLFAVSPRDPVAFAVTGAVLLAVA